MKIESAGNTRRRIVPAVLACLLPSLLLFGCSAGSDPDSASPPDSTQDMPPAVSNAANSIVASVLEAGDVQAYVGQTKTITLSFRTSDGAAASALKVALPAAPGWQAGGELACPSVAEEGSCQIRLSYAPGEPAPGSSLRLGYSYIDSAGAGQTGSLAIDYSALAANAATVSIDPAGPVRGLVGAASSVTLRFDTNDGTSATNLRILTDLSALPSGWSGNAASAACPSFGGGAGCQLQLSYMPTADTQQSSLAISYGYTNSGGKPQTGSASIAYSALARDTVGASVAPDGVIVSSPMESREVTLTFSASDGTPATGLKLDDGASWPAGWSIKSSTLPCEKVGMDGSCRLVLNFLPEDSQPQQQFALAYTYVNGAGLPMTGKASIDYSSRRYRAYVADFYDGNSANQSGGVRQCEIAADGTLGNCDKAAATWPVPGTNRVVISGSRAYVATNQSAAWKTPSISKCVVAADGALGNCAALGVNYDGISSLSLLGPYAYLTSMIDGISRITRCGLDGLGNLGGLQADGCIQLPLDITGKVVSTVLASLGSSLYVATVEPPVPGRTGLLQCKPDAADAANLKCRPSPTAYPLDVQGMAAARWKQGAYLYLASANNTSGTVVKCRLDADGAILGCDGGHLPPGVDGADLRQLSDIGIIDDQAYLALVSKILRCPIDTATGDLKSCVSAGDTGSAAPIGIALR